MPGALTYAPSPREADHAALAYPLDVATQFSAIRVGAVLAAVAFKNRTVLWFAMDVTVHFWLLPSNSKNLLFAGPQFARSCPISSIGVEGNAD
jgi:hypothetical protein